MTQIVLADDVDISVNVKPEFRLWQGFMATLMGAGGILFLLRTFVMGTDPKEKVEMLLGGAIIFILILVAIGMVLAV